MRACGAGGWRLVCRTASTSLAAPTCWWCIHFCTHSSINHKLWQEELETEAMQAGIRMHSELDGSRPP